MATTTRKWKNAANPELSRAMHELGRSNATAPHQDGRHRRARTRQAVIARARRDDY